ncbi:MAG: helix-turn-helix domain-containing protein [Lewinella sp.]|nr:helix-turn-helix domain-containing protein [Lewinella sp.]
MKSKQKRSVSEFNNELQLSGFKVFQIEADSPSTRTYSRKDFYKICLTTGKSVIHYADRSYEAEGTILFFGNPHIPYSWETLSTHYVGYTCLFSEEFLQLSDRAESLQQSPLFRIGGTPILHITEAQRQFLNGLFEKMIEEQASDYAHKDDLIRNYIQLVLHEAMKLKPSENYSRHSNAALRIARVFLELLERQFPIESPDQPLPLRTAQEYADNLAVHVNHLNRSLKEVTGKSTSTLINERIVSEAKAILLHTDWNVSDVAYALGFKYPTYFNNFFKKMTGATPTTIREQLV